MSLVDPECFPVGSLQFSCSRYGSCPRCKRNHETIFVICNSSAAQWPYACMTGCSILFNLPELLFVAHELDESVLIRLAPLQLQSGTVDHVRLQKQTSGLLVQPVLWRGVFLHGTNDTQIKLDWEPDPDILVCSRDRSEDLRTLRSMFSRISSMEPCCLMRSMARLGPIPLMVPQ